jgi:hypothetical protein
MSKARLIITAVVVEGRSQREVARANGINQSWVSRLRPAQPFPRAPGAGTPLICWRVFVREEAVARGEDVTPGHWLLALLRDAEDPVDTALDGHPVERRKRAMFGLPNHGSSPVRLLVESQGLTLDQLRTAVLEELDQDR